MYHWVGITPEIWVFLVNCILLVKWQHRSTYTSMSVHFIIGKVNGSLEYFSKLNFINNFWILKIYTSFNKNKKHNNMQYIFNIFRALLK